MGAYDRALPLYQRTLQIIEKSLGPEHPHTIVTVNNLGSLYLARKDYPAAEAYFRRGRSTGGLVELWLARGQPGKALKLLQDQPLTWRDLPVKQVQYYTQRGLALAGEGRLGEAALDLAAGGGGGGGPAPPGAGRTDRLLPGRHLWRLCAALPGAGERAGGDVPETGGPAAGAPGVRPRGRGGGLLLCRRHQGPGSPGGHGPGGPAADPGGDSGRTAAAGGRPAEPAGGACGPAGEGREGR